MGHSAGGLIAQLLIDRGLASAAVGVGSGAIKGVVPPLSTIRATFPVLGNPFNRGKATGLTAKQFHYAFCNTLSREESDKIYERQHVAAANRVMFQIAFAIFNPNGPTRIDFENDDRAPMLFIAFDQDHLARALERRGEGVRVQAAHGRTDGFAPGGAGEDGGPRSRPGLLAVRRDDAAHGLVLHVLELRQQHRLRVVPTHLRGRLAGCHERPAVAPHDRPDPRAVDDSAQLGAVDRPLLASRPSRARTALARHGGGGRGAATRPVPDDQARHRQDRRPLRRHHPRPGKPTDRHGPLRRRTIRPAADRPWPRERSGRAGLEEVADYALDWATGRPAARQAW